MFRRQERKSDLLSEFECDYIGIQGEEGSGKTTLLSALLSINHYFKYKKKKKTLLKKIKTV